MEPLVIKDRLYLVMDSNRQEVHLKLNKVDLDVTNKNIQSVFSEYGEVKEVTNDRWKVQGFECADQSTKFVKLLLKEGVTLDDIPYQIWLGSRTALVVVPGRALFCLH